MFGSGLRPRYLFGTLNRGDEAISQAGNSFYVARLTGGIVEDASQLLDGCVEAVLKIHERIGGPEALLELFAGDNLTGVLDEQAKNLKGLRSNLNPGSKLEEFTRVRADFKGPKSSNGNRRIHQILLLLADDRLAKVCLMSHLGLHLYYTTFSPPHALTVTANWAIFSVCACVSVFEGRRVAEAHGARKRVACR
jgi:hypothetical protein